MSSTDFAAPNTMLFRSLTVKSGTQREGGGREMGKGRVVCEGGGGGVHHIHSTILNPLLYRWEECYNDSHRRGSRRQSHHNSQSIITEEFHQNRSQVHTHVTYVYD